MSKETVLGIVLSAGPVGESDKRLVILTREKGKISAFAKGARKPNSPLLGCSQPFAFGEFTVYMGRNSFSVLSAEISNYFAELRNDLEKLYYGFYFCEFSDYFTRENLDAKEVLKLLYQSLRVLIKGTIKNELVRYIFEWKQIVLNGESPEIFSCICCKQEENLTIFSCTCHGMICVNCKQKIGRGRGIPILPSTVYTLQFISHSKIEKLYTFTVTDRVQEELRQCVSSYLDYQIGYKFHSLDMLNQL